MVSRFFTRMIGLYEEECLLIQIEVKYLRLQTKHAFPKVYLEIARGDAKFTLPAFSIESGINEIDIERCHYIRTSNFYRDKESPKDAPSVYQPKELAFSIFRPKDTSLGEEKPKLIAEGLININEYCNQVRTPLNIYLTKSTKLMDTKLQAVISVVPKSRMLEVGGNMDFDAVKAATKKQGDTTQKFDCGVYRRETKALATGKQFSIDLNKKDIGAAIIATFKGTT